MPTGLKSQIIVPDWALPSHVKAFSTTRSSGVSQGVYCSNNLALHVGDSEVDVLKNRALLCENYVLPSEPHWLNQTHSTKIVKVEKRVEPNQLPINADASFSMKRHEVCVVMTADCLPVLLCDKSGTQVAAIHAGWRGLLNGIIEKTRQEFSMHGKDIIAWLGPAIGSNAFEVGPEVRDSFLEKDSSASIAFQSHKKDKWLADIYMLARLRLNRCGIEAVYGGDFCTFSDETLFYSYRRDGVCGRMASLIWLDK